MLAPWPLSLVLHLNKVRVGEFESLVVLLKVGSDIGALLDAWLMSRGPWALSLVSSRLLASSGVANNGATASGDGLCGRLGRGGDGD